MPHSDVEILKFAGQLQVRILSVRAQLVGAEQMPISCASCDTAGRLAGEANIGEDEEAETNVMAANIDLTLGFCISGFPLSLKI